ncbi:hypothetical protein [Aquitalea sp. LB_tupeE]|uniref:hypothetical protein n=1 Tax=Aquitalea sp. LB_tupeE TaxID=2748078 RepID=UPI0015BC94C5|nr:hypothetical protein [Aquitalea sp. LB_tupeE]NWK80405.1 hypothetical protein [Aquitalea sp. LB_tupeE]
MDKNFSSYGENSGTKSIVSSLIFFIVGTPILTIGVFMIFGIAIISKPLNSDTIFLFIIGILFCIGGFWCLSRSLGYATGKAKLFLPGEGRKGPVITSIVVMAPLLRLINHIEQANPHWLMGRTWIEPAALVLIVSTPFFVWWWHYRWKRMK